MSTAKTAPVAAAIGTDGWADAERLQRWAAGDHTDFYRIAGEFDETLNSMHALADTLRSQVTQYGEGREVYDDTRSHDPHERLKEAAYALGMLAQSLVMATRYAAEFHNAIGHIGVET